MLTAILYFIKVEGQKRGTGLINFSMLQDGELSLANIGLLWSSLTMAPTAFSCDVLWFHHFSGCCLWGFVTSLYNRLLLFWCRKRLFNMINDLPTIFEVVTGTVKKQVKEKSSVSNHSSSKSKSNSKVWHNFDMPIFSLSLCKPNNWMGEYCLVCSYLSGKFHTHYYKENNN